MPIAPPNIEYSDKGSANKTPLILSVVVAVVAAGISVWGVNSSGLTAGVSTPQSLPAELPNVAPPEDKVEQEKLLKAGSKLHQERCAGCHAADSKLSGPSYAEICRKYGESVDIPGNPSPGVTDQVSTTALSAISYATTHPGNVWDTYQQGPQLGLTADERRAVSFWIFNISKDKEEADE